MNEKKVLLIDLSNNSSKSIPYSFKTDGEYGRNLVLDFFKKLVPDEAGRYSPDNLIVIAPGLFAGAQAPSACRMSVATIEAEGKGIQLCNTSGNMPQKLGSLGIVAIVIKGRFAHKGAVIHIDDKGVDIFTEESLYGVTSSEIISKLKNRYDKDSAIIGCSIAGDMMMSLSSFICTYPNGTPEYHCARYGFGDVFGSKNLKAVVVDSTEYFGAECADPDRFRDLGRELTHRITSDEICGQILPKYGSVAIMNLINGQDLTLQIDTGEGLVTDNEISLVSNGTNRNKTCAPMCVIGCLNRHIKDGKILYESPSQVETQGAIYRCFGVDDFRLADDVQRRASEIGIAATEFVTACKAFAEANRISCGADHLLEWISEIERGTPIGRIISSRTYGVSELYSDYDLEKWIDRKAVQDEEMYDVVLKTKLSELADASALEALYAQLFVLENLGFCLFTSFALLDNSNTFDLLAEMFEAKTGVRMTSSELLSYAHKCIDVERDYYKHRWQAAQRNNIPPFTRALYSFFDSKKERHDD